MEIWDPDKNTIQVLVDAMPVEKNALHPLYGFAMVTVAKYKQLLIIGGYITGKKKD